MELWWTTSVGNVQWLTQCYWDWCLFNRLFFLDAGLVTPRVLLWISQLADALIRIVLSGIWYAAVRDEVTADCTKAGETSLESAWISLVHTATPANRKRTEVGKAGEGKAWDTTCRLWMKASRISLPDLPPYRLQQESKSGSTALAVWFEEYMRCCKEVAWCYEFLWQTIQNCKNQHKLIIPAGLFMVNNVSSDKIRKLRPQMSAKTSARATGTSSWFVLIQCKMLMAALVRGWWV